MPEHLIRAFIDANVLFSASYKDSSSFLDFWRCRAVEAVTSAYAVGQVSRNIRSIAQRQRFEALIARTIFVSDGDIRFIPAHVQLPAKDQPILAAAIGASMDYLLTSDIKHFDRFYDTKVAHVRILHPSAFLSLHADRLLPAPLA